MQGHVFCLATLVGLIAGCSGSDEQTPSREVACEVAADYVKRFVGEAERFRVKHEDAPQFIAVSEAPYHLLPVITEEGPVEGDLPDTIREVSDWRSVTMLPQESVLDACIGLKSWLSDRAIISDDEQIKPLTSGADWEAHILSTAMPIFTENGRSAVIFASKRTGGLSGVGILAVYSKNEDGQWLLVAEEMRWIS